MQFKVHVCSGGWERWKKEKKRAKMCWSGVTGQAPLLPPHNSLFLGESQPGKVANQFSGCCAFKAHLPFNLCSWQGTADYNEAAVVRQDSLFWLRATDITSLKDALYLLSWCNVKYLQHHDAFSSVWTTDKKHWTPQAWERNPKHLNHAHQENLRI